MEGHQNTDENRWENCLHDGQNTREIRPNDHQDCRKKGDTGDPAAGVQATCGNVSQDKHNVRVDEKLLSHIDDRRQSDVKKIEKSHTHSGVEPARRPPGAVGRPAAVVGFEDQKESTQVDCQGGHQGQRVLRVG